MEINAPEKPNLSMLLRGFPPHYYFFPLVLSRGKATFVELELRMQTIREAIDRLYLIIPPETEYAQLEKAVGIITRYERQAGLLLPPQRSELFKQYEDLIEDGLSELMLNFNASEPVSDKTCPPPQGVRLSARLSFDIDSAVQLTDWAESFSRNPLPIKELWVTLSGLKNPIAAIDRTRLADALSAINDLGRKYGFPLSFFTSSGLTPCIVPPEIWPGLIFPIDVEKNLSSKIPACVNCAVKELCPGLPKKIALTPSFEPAAVPPEQLGNFKKPIEAQLADASFLAEDREKQREKEKRLSIVYVEVTQKCPLNCASCFMKDRGAILPDPPLERVYKAIDNIAPHSGTIWIVGFGEPLSRRELPEIIAHIRSAGAKAGITSSGMFLSERRAELMAASPPEYLALSLSSFDPALFARLRDGKLEEMLKSLANAKKYWGDKTQFFASYLIQRENLPRLAMDVEEAARVGFNVFVPQPFVSFSAEIEKRSSPYGDMALLTDALAAARETASRCGIEMYPVAINPQEIGPCAFELETRCIVRADMSVGPCCPQFSALPSPMCFGGIEGVMHGLSFGYADRTPLPEIFDSAEYRLFREEALSAAPPEMCRQCGFTRGVYTPS